MKNRLVLILAGMLAFSFTAEAQKYITAAGLRVEKHRMGLTVQQRVLPKSTIEFLGMAGAREVSATGMFQQHFPIITNGLNYYVGGGAHLGHGKEHGVFYGADAVIGLEAKLLFTRLLLSADLKPAVHINHEDYFGLQGGFSVRYILIKERKKKISIFGGDKKKNSGGLFSPKKEEEKPKFNLFGPKEEEKTEPKFKLFSPKEEEKAPEKKKFRLFPDREESVEEPAE